ncbi:hypothetical protein GO730_28370 [Spirosoma sp. HMF3257]|uniref:hypothetical protein n=1 Tax=Spirosoma telluris TaxID=2183553 RepID=UPI0011B94123|nr:hypothetical protein [Spirosoma telluris]
MLASGSLGSCSGLAGVGVLFKARERAVSGFISGDLAGVIVGGAATVAVVGFVFAAGLVTATALVESVFMGGVGATTGGFTFGL